MSEQPSPARLRFLAAVEEAVAVAEQLEKSGQTARLAGFQVGVDIGTSACFLWDTSDVSCDRATEVIHRAIAHATRTGD